MSGGCLSDLWLCPKRGGPMMVIERLTAAEIHLRSLPTPITEAANARWSTVIVHTLFLKAGLR